MSRAPLPRAGLANPTALQVTALDMLLARALDEAPWCAAALCRLPLVPCPGLGTFAVDAAGRIYVDPSQFAVGTSVAAVQHTPPGVWSMQEAAWVLIHEAWHWLREHHARAERWYALRPDLAAHTLAELINDCEDAEINGDLRAEGAKLPSGGRYPEQFAGKPGELWEVLLERVLPPPQQGAGQSQQGAGQSQQGAGQSQGAPDPRQGVSPRLGGSGAHGLSMPWELPVDGDLSASPEQREATRGLTHEEASALRDTVAAAVLEHVKSRGTEAGGMGLWASKRLSPPEVDWRRELRAAVASGIQQARGMDDYSYVRPSRRGSFCGVIQPSLVAPVPEVVVVIDTSGSMSRTDRDAALAEVQGVIRALGQRELRVICVDARPTDPQRVRSARDVKLIGGGGTDMRVGIEAALLAKAKVIVVLTDGHTPWPAERPRRARIIAGMVGHERGAYPAHPEWLRCVAIPKHQLRGAA